MEPINRPQLNTIFWKPICFTHYYFTFYRDRPLIYLRLFSFVLLRVSAVNYSNFVRAVGEVTQYYFWVRTERICVPHSAREGKTKVLIVMWYYLKSGSACATMWNETTVALLWKWFHLLILSMCSIKFLSGLRSVNTR